MLAIFNFKTKKSSINFTSYANKLIKSIYTIASFSFKKFIIS
jgi:hypothetical protein